ncbi:MAG: Gfo/Idh/MocA family oxidoreductase [Pseudomonadota bacterium]
MNKLRWGMIGGGEGSQIGDTHRLAAGLDGHFALTAGALDIDPDRGRAFGASLGIAPDRAYGSWREMLDAEGERSDRLDLVTIATPNNTHYEIARAFLDAGFAILCEKPMTLAVEEAADLIALSRVRRVLCAVNYGYSGYPLIRHARAMVKEGAIGKVRVVTAEFAHGGHADAKSAEAPGTKWRYDPALAGDSAVLTDAGSHALFLSSFILDQKIQQVNAVFDRCMPGRELEDDALLALRFSEGAVGRLWTSSIAIGQMHGLTIRVFGETGGLSWSQEQPNQLFHSPLGQPTQILERGTPYLAADAQESSRVSGGHAEGFVEAMANLYADIAKVLSGGPDAEAARRRLPKVEDGFDGVAVVAAAVASARDGTVWTEVETA